MKIAQTMELLKAMQEMLQKIKDDIRTGEKWMPTKLSFILLCMDVNLGLSH
jgi:hypothetical protein